MKHEWHNNIYQVCHTWHSNLLNRSHQVWHFSVFTDENIEVHILVITVIMELINGRRSHCNFHWLWNFCFLKISNLVPVPFNWKISTKITPMSAQIPVNKWYRQAEWKPTQWNSVCSGLKVLPYTLMLLPGRGKGLGLLLLIVADPWTASVLIHRMWQTWGNVRYWVPGFFLWQLLLVCGTVVLGPLLRPPCCEEPQADFRKMWVGGRRGKPSHHPLL